MRHQESSLKAKTKLKIKKRMNQHNLNNFLKTKSSKKITHKNLNKELLKKLTVRCFSLVPKIRSWPKFPLKQKFSYFNRHWIKTFAQI